MAWNDYIFDYENGSKFESERYQVYFDMTNEQPQIKDLTYSQIVPNYADSTFELQSISGGNPDLYAITWFEVSNYSIDATSRGLNDISLSYTPSLNLPQLTYDDGTFINYPMTSSVPVRSPFVEPLRVIERQYARFGCL